MSKLMTSMVWTIGYIPIGKIHSSIMESILRSLLFHVAVIAVTAFANDQSYAQVFQKYDYDVHGRLTGSSVDVGPVGSVSNYTLDDASNRTARTSFPAMSVFWEAETMAHSTGRNELDGRVADVSDGEGFLDGGPYTANAPLGNRIAVWRIMTDAPLHPSGAPIVRLDVWDINEGKSLATTYLAASDWRSGLRYELFELPFVVDTENIGHEMEFRTYFFPVGFVKIDKVSYRCLLRAHSVWFYCRLFIDQLDVDLAAALECLLFGRVLAGRRQSSYAPVARFRSKAGAYAFVVDVETVRAVGL